MDKARRLESDSAARPAQEPALAEARVTEINASFLSAWAAADADAVEAMTESGFLLTDSSGEWIERASCLEQLRRRAPAFGLSCEDHRVRFFGNIALLHGLYETRVDRGQPKRTRYTTALRSSGGEWRLIHAQHTELRVGVSAEERKGTAIRPSPWRGEDPRGEDLEVLRALNENYVRAFREADVAWYEAHLAEDYVVVNGDGSFDDRAQALAEFARPVFATALNSFPVDKVLIRRFDDMALIHAENAYELKDGRRGVNRYADIWRKLGDGSWTCLAAHITANKLPSPPNSISGAR